VVLVTSRHTLAGLGARLVDLAVLARRDGAAMLDGALREARPGDARITADPAAARRLAGAYGGLPLALQIAIDWPEHVSQMTSSAATAGFWYHTGFRL
jgi:hypothetical protein